MGDFQAVDLDAVLDQFEFHEEEKLKLKNGESATTSSVSTTTTSGAQSAPFGTVDAFIDDRKSLIASDEEPKDFCQNQVGICVRGVTTAEVECVMLDFHAL